MHAPFFASTVLVLPSSSHSWDCRGCLRLLQVELGVPRKVQVERGRNGASIDQINVERFAASGCHVSKIEGVLR